MQTLVVGLALLVAANTAPKLALNGSCGKAAKQDAKKGPPAVDPNVAASKAHGGKVWVLTGAAPNVEGEDLVKWLARHAPAAAPIPPKYRTTVHESTVANATSSDSSTRIKLLSRAYSLCPPRLVPADFNPRACAVKNTANRITVAASTGPVP